jgi:hypothetical protein
VADEDIGQLQALLQVASRFSTCAWMETSSADTGSSRTSNIRLQHQGAGNGDALALAAGEHVRVAVNVRAQAHLASSWRALASRSPP